MLDVLYSIQHIHIALADLQYPTTPRRSSNIRMTPEHYYTEASIHKLGSVGERKDTVYTLDFATPSEWDPSNEVESLDENWNIDDEMGPMTPRRARRTADDLLLELQVLDTIRARTELRRQRILKAAGHILTKPTR